MLTLSHDAFRLELVPDVGGSIAAFYSEHDGVRRDWLRPATPEAIAARDPLRMGSFPLAPWCNRIRNGRCGYGAIPIELPPNFKDSPHTIHGTSWQRPWEVESASESDASLTQEHRPAEGSRDWPYAFDARQTFKLDERGLSVEIALTNRSAHPMPAGIGHHPYFPHPRGTRLTTRVDAMWDSDADLLPTGLTQPVFLSRLAGGVDLDEIVLDNNFIGWSREARVDWPEQQAGLIMRAQAPLDYFVLYSPRNEDHFVMEPVSNCTDWMNLAAQGIGDAGGMVLAPEQTLSGRFQLLPINP
jgi:aldose 1-epimerase